MRQRRGNGLRILVATATTILVTTIGTVGAACGCETPIFGGGGGAEPGLANIFVNTTAGGTPTRSATPVEYDAGAAYGSLDAANDAASCGDTILIKGGSYGDQNITGDRTCGGGSWVADDSKGVTMTGGVLMGVAPSESVTIGDLALQADWVELSGEGGTFQIGTGGGADHNVNANGSNTTNNTIIRNVSMAGSLFTNNVAQAGLRVSNFAYVDSEHGPWDGSGPGAEPIYMQTCSGCSGDTITENVYIDGITFHDVTIPGTPDPHIEIVRIDGGNDGVWVRNSTFTDNLETNTAVIFTTWSIYGGGSGAIRPTNVNIVNNYFDSDMVNGVLFELGGGGACVDFTIAYNTLAGGGVTSGNCTPTNMNIVGNLGVKGSAGCYSGATYIKNVWQHSSDVACGTDTWVNGTAGSTDALGLSGFVLQAGSVALEAGETTHCPALDHDGGTRPDPGATNCDAGADERG